jgi:hypothetical protein
MRNLKSLSLKICWKLLRMILPKKSAFRTFSGEFFSNKYLMKLDYSKIIWCYTHGFLPKEYFAFNLAKNDPNKYLSRLNNVRRGSINGEYSYILGNKIFFERHIKSVIEGIDNLHVIENIAYIDHGNLKSLNKKIIPGKFSSLIAFLEKKDLILKPVSGSRGRGVLLLQKNEDQYLLDFKPVSWEQVVSDLSSLDNYLIQERFIQVGFSHDIYNGSLNCMRICTMIDPETNEPFIPYALHRFGSRDSGYTDNSSLGAISAVISADGRLEIGRTLNKNGVIELYEIHPLSNKRIYKEQIPNWENISKSIIEMVRRMPYLNNIGWDVVLSDGELYILEGNIGPGVNIIQVHLPLSDIPRAWNFYKHYKFFN